MLEYIFSSYTTFYNDPWFWQFGMATLLVSSGVFLGFSLPFTLFAWADPKWAANHKLQDKPFNVRTTIGTTSFYFIRNSLVMVLLFIVVWPVMSLSQVHLGELPPWYVSVFQVVVSLTIYDFGFYYLHRWMHENRDVYKKVHSLHHKITNPYALAGNYQHWFEFIALGSFAVIGPILMGTHLYVLWVVVAIIQIGAVVDHCGYNIRSPFELLLRTAAHHNFHHSRFIGSYAGLSGFPDQLHKSDNKLYMEYKALKKQGLSNAEARADVYSRKNTA